MSQINSRFYDSQFSLYDIKDGKSKNLLFSLIFYHDQMGGEEGGNPYAKNCVYSNVKMRFSLLCQSPCLSTPHIFIQLSNK